MLAELAILAQVLAGNGALRPGGSGISGPFQQLKVVAGAFATNPSTNLTFTSNVTSGGTIVMYGGAGGLQTAWNSPTKSGTATLGAFTAQGSCVSGNTTANQCIWTAAITGSGTLTITISATSSGNTVLIGVGYELNSQVAGTVDGTPTYENHAGCTSCTLATLTTTGTNRAILTFVFSGGTQTRSNPSPFTIDSDTHPQGAQTTAGHYVQGTAGTYSPSISIAVFATLSDSSIAIF